VGSTRLRHTVGVRPRRSRWTQGALAGESGREGPSRNTTPHRAVPVAVAASLNDVAAMHNLPQRTFRLNLRPGRAHRLSEAGRHSAPIARQRATREERHSGLAWPAYCDKPKWRRPSWTAWGALSPRATVVVHRKVNSCIWHFSRARPLAAPVALLEYRGHLSKIKVERRRSAPGRRAAGRRLASNGRERPMAALRASPKRPDGSALALAVRVYEAAVRRLRQPAISSRTEKSAKSRRSMVHSMESRRSTFEFSGWRRLCARTRG
jgi:hypothetical protein